MLRLMRKFVNWAEKRWPERVVVTQADYLALNRKLDGLEANLVRVGELETRVKKLEEHLSKMNLVLGIASGTATLER